MSQEDLRPALEELCGVGATRFRDEHLKLLWENEYRDSYTLSEAREGSLKAIGLPSGLVDMILNAQERRKAAAEAAGGGGQPGLDSMREQLTELSDRLTRLEQSSRSAVSASSINEQDLDLAFRDQGLLKCRPVDSASVDELLRQDTPSPPLFLWSAFEIQDKERYLRHIQSWLPEDCRLFVHDVSSQVKDMLGQSVRMRGKNDVLIVPIIARGGLEMQRAVVGIELKKPERLTLQAIRQAQAEFIIFASITDAPFIQVLTDLNRGGIAYWVAGEADNGMRTLIERVFVSMEDLSSFVRNTAERLPRTIGCLKPDGVNVDLPQELPFPKRMKFSGRVIRRGGGIYELAEQFLSVADDVGNVEDLVGFPELYKPPPWYII